jgi:protoheme IX farnesyltransferase
MNTAVEVTVPGNALAMARAYLTLTKPTVIVLLLITTIPAMVLASEGWPDTRLVLSTLLGGFLAAGGAAAINHYADRDIDRMMTRTRSRPVASGLVAPAHAVTFGLALSASSVVWMAWQVNVLSALLGLGAIVMYAGVYTYGLKRTTVQNIVIGGAAGAAPPLIGWAAVTNSIEAPALLLFLIVFFWTPPHFWALSLRLEEDYRSVNLPMGPVVWGVPHTKLQIELYTYLLVAMTLMFGAVAELRWLYFSVAVLGGLGFVWYARRLRHSEGVRLAIPVYLYSLLYLAALFAAVMADVLVLG